MEEATAAFDGLVDARVEQQQAGLVRDDEPRRLARFIWATVHGTAMLASDGQLKRQDEQAQDLTGYAIERLRDAIRRLEQPALRGVPRSREERP